MKRHLLYHIYPVKGNGVWQWNVTQIQQRLGLFDGVVSIAVVTDDTTDTLEKVRHEFGNYPGHNWINLVNDSKLREVVTWRPLWNTVTDLEGYVFWGHAKGVRHGKFDPLSPVIRWANLLYMSCLDHWPKVKAIFDSGKVCVGSFRRIGEMFKDFPASKWHYSGGMFWLDNSIMWIPDTMPKIWHGTESWIGSIIPLNDSGVLIGHGYDKAFDPYNAAIIDAIEKEYVAWSR